MSRCSLIQCNISSLLSSWRMVLNRPRRRRGSSHFDLTRSLQLRVRQQTVVDGVRTRASAIFAAATLATSFLGAQALTRSPKLDGLAWLAIGAFAAIFASVGYVLWPRKFRFVLSARVLIEDHFGKTTDA